MSDLKLYNTTTALFGSQQLVLPRCVLDVVEGVDKGKQAIMDQGRATVGTHADNALVLTDPHVSRFHLVLERTPQGYHLQDLDTTNGTWVGALRVVDAYLSEPVVLRVGQTTLRFAPEDRTMNIIPLLEDRMGHLIGRSTSMRTLFGAVRRLASARSTVLLTGETGTGKEGLAQLLHEQSPWASQPFVVVDCTAIPPGLFESELFGHTKGAFTGAVRDHRGALQRANKGTLFLDEIGELPLDMQAKLLRFLETQTFRPVGAESTVQVNVRVVSATHRNLYEEMQSRRFRADLFYRLAIVELPVPPLRERTGDIPLLCQTFLQEFVQLHSGLPARTLAPIALHWLQTLPWPGNVRELRNALWAAATLSTDPVIQIEHFSERLRGSQPHVVENTSAISPNDGSFPPFKEKKAALLEQFEQEYLHDLVRHCDGNISQASRVSGLDRKYIYRLLEKYDLR